MTATAMLMREVETLPEEVAAEALNFVLFLQSRKKPVYGDLGKNRFLGMNKPKKMPHCIGIDMSGFKFNRDDANER